MFDIHAYKEVLSDYRSDISSEQWKSKTIVIVNHKTGEIKELPMYVFDSKNIGKKMSIDDKAIGRDGFTIFSNGETSKIALMVESTRCEDVVKSLSLFGDKLQIINSVSSDMATGYLSAVSEIIPQAKRVIDKFHLMQYAYDVPLAVRTKIQKELREKLSDKKGKTEEDKLILNELELLQHCRYRLTQSPDKCSEASAELMAEIFAKYPQLKQAYDLVQDLKKWYDKSRCRLDKIQIKNDLYDWYKKAQNSGIEEFKQLIKMLRKHEYEVLNYFSTDGQSNARAERLNGKINRFIAANYGIKDKDFVLWRLKGYFA